MVTREASHKYQVITYNHPTLRFSCDERKICSTIKKAQNIMNIILDYDLACYGLPSKLLKCSRVTTATLETTINDKLLKETFDVDTHLP